MHQWWGDNVSEANFDLTFFKEGMATVGEYLFAARERADRGRWSRHGGRARGVPAEPGRTGSTPPTPARRRPLDGRAVRPDAGQPVLREYDVHPAGTAYLALRQILGPHRFVRALRRIQHRFGGGSITEPQLEAQFAHFLPHRSQRLPGPARAVLHQWFDTAYPAGGGATARS